MTPYIPPPVQVVEAAPVTERTWTKAELETLVANTARAHHLDAHQFVEVARCESINFIDPKIQSGYPGKGPHGREDSWGIFQIHLPSHEVTREQAQDPVFAAEWAAAKWEKGQQYLWTCWRSQFGK